MSFRRSATYALVILFIINVLNFFDRQILGAVAEPVRKEFGFGDKEMGLINTAFTLLYGFVGVPLGRLADKATRTRLLVGGVFFWSLMTAATGMARNTWQLVAARLGVGVGEAVCAPAGSSLIGDLFPATKRARALAIFMMGLPIGIALSYAVSGWIARQYGWRPSFYAAGVAGLLCMATAWVINEPERGTVEAHGIGMKKREGSPYKLVFSNPTMRWIILSGVLLNFNMYVVGSFLAAFTIRFYKIDIQTAGLILMFVHGLSGMPGLWLGGVLGDGIGKQRANGRMLLGTIASLLTVPLTFFALYYAAHSLFVFSLLMGVGIGLMYVYYSTVYSTIHDVIEPALRGTAMALYFFAMYLCGAAFGSTVVGFLSDYFSEQAALAAGVDITNKLALEPFRAAGLHSALYSLPIIAALLTLVLYAGSRTVTQDMKKLQDWMRQQSGQ
jgi:MFS family permease